MVKMRRCLSRKVSTPLAQVVATQVVGTHVLAHLRASGLCGGGAFLREHRQRRVNDAAQCRFGDTGEMFGENAAVMEVGGVLVPADAYDPVAGGFRGNGGDNLRGGNYEQGTQARIERPNAIWTDEELNCRRLDILRLPDISRLVVAAVYDDEGAEPRGGIGQRRIGLCSGKQDGGEEHGEAGDGGCPTVPETERENYERRAADGEDDAEGEPASGIAAKVEKLGQKEHERKEGAEAEIPEAGSGGFLLRCDGS